MTAHAKLSASGSHRWMACSASVRLEAQFPDKSSSYADEGTAAHKLAEQALLDQQDAAAYVGQDIYTAKDGTGYAVDREMADATQDFLDYVRKLPGLTFGERRLDYSPWVPHGFGTADFISIDDGRYTVVDLKYGKGVSVYAEENTQAMLYGLGALNEFSFTHPCDEVKLTIVQPRTHNISEWTISSDLLLEFGEYARERAAATEDPNAPFNPGEKQCMFCKAKTTCRARAEYLLSSACEGFEAVGDEITTRNPDLLTNEELSEILEQADALRTWSVDVQSHATNLLLNGEKVPGYKLVEGKSNRKWADEVAIGKALARKVGAKNAYIKKPITITAAEKLLGKDGKVLIEKHTTKPPGKPTLALESSPKPAINIDPTEGFEAVDA